MGNSSECSKGPDSSGYVVVDPKIRQLKLNRAKYTDARWSHCASRSGSAALGITKRLMHMGRNCAIVASERKAMRWGYLHVS